MKSLKIVKKLAGLILIFIFAFSLTAVASPVLAQATSDDLLWGGTRDEVDAAIGLGNEDPRIIIASIINVILGFLGIIAVVIILIAGFKWMTAGGNEDKIGEAKAMLSAGIIGLAIILASWGLARWVVDLLYQKTSGN